MGLTMHIYHAKHIFRHLMKVYICSEIVGGEVVYINITILLSYMVKMIT